MKSVSIIWCQNYYKVSRISKVDCLSQQHFNRRRLRLIFCLISETVPPEQDPLSWTPVVTYTPKHVNILPRLKNARIPLLSFSAETQYRFGTICNSFVECWQIRSKFVYCHMWLFCVLARGKFWLAVKASESVCPYLSRCEFLVLVRL